QAEDGIRDDLVTGVQTCALPICTTMTTGFADEIHDLPDDRLAALIRLRPDLAVPVPGDLSALAARAQARVSVARALEPLDRFTQIGRASCRERVGMIGRSRAGRG